ncbi:MAG: hypothetical protein ACLFR1_11085 [Spirochaetia bacterium]
MNYPGPEQLAFTYNEYEVHPDLAPTHEQPGRWKLLGFSAEASGKRGIQKQITPEYFWDPWAAVQRVRLLVQQEIGKRN